MKASRLMFAAAAALIGMGTALPAAAAVDKAPLQVGGRRYDARRGIFPGGFVPSVSRERRAGRGWSNRHVQRMAAKKRNQARHRKACRGRA